jgi:hypothetical protein
MALTQPNQTAWGDTFPPMVKNAAEMKSSVAVELPLTSYPQKLFPPGIFAGTNGATFRLLPRTKFKSNAAAVITVSPFTAGLFFVGDVITQINLADGTAGTAVGTVVSVQHAANTVTLSATPGTIPAFDAVIGVATSRPVLANGNKLGLIQPNTSINLDDTGRNPMVSNNHFACIQSGSFYRLLAPHVDAELERLFPEMIFS